LKPVPVVSRAKPIELDENDSSEQSKRTALPEMEWEQKGAPLQL
jgi:hypothetical protein